MLLKIDIFKKDFVALLLCSFCLLLLSLFLNICIAEAICNGGTPDGTLDSGEMCDGANFRGISSAPATCEDLGDSSPTSTTSGNNLICNADCTIDSSMCSGGLQSPPKPGDVPDDFKGSVLNITNWLLGFVTAIAVLVIIWGGINYLTSAGDEDKARTGKKTLTYALLGLVVVGIAYALVNVVIGVILG
ncbi:MAG: pilin [Patescibacteria group bacterium]|nr:pilin [Patescibacteria group bacterium]